MAMPGFTADLSVGTSSCQHRPTVDHAFTDDQMSIGPAQHDPPVHPEKACCITRTGVSTSFGGVVSTVTLAGVTQECREPFRYALVEACYDFDTQRTTIRQRGCRIDTGW